jgi:hypothetical protein
LHASEPVGWRLRAAIRGPLKGGRAERVEAGIKRCTPQALPAARVFMGSESFHASEPVGWRLRAVLFRLFRRRPAYLSDPPRPHPRGVAATVAWA